MRLALVSLWILTAAGAFAAGRLLAPGAGEPASPAVASLEDALGTPDELERAHRVIGFLRAMGPADLPEARRTLEEASLEVTPEQLRLFMLAWSRFDATGAFAWALTLPAERSEKLMEQAIYAWGFRDGPAAVRGLEAVEDSELRKRLRRPLAEGWIHGADRAGATGYVATIENPRQRGRLTFLLAADTMRDGPEALIRWADSVPETAPNDFKRAAFHQAATLLARENPRRAAAWFEEHRMHPYSAGTPEGIAVRWSDHHDPPALFDWLRSLPADGERASERADAISAGFRVWVQRDRGQAEEWLAAELPDPALDPAIVELVRLHTRTSPESALEWAARIDDAKLRRNAMVRAGRGWRRRAPQAFDAWLSASDLPGDLRQAMLDRGAPARDLRNAGAPTAVRR